MKIAASVNPQALFYHVHAFVTTLREKLGLNTQMGGIFQQQQREINN